MVRTRKFDAFDIVNGIFLFFIFAAMLYPFIYVLAVSLSSPDAVMQNKVVLYPIGLNLMAYRVVTQIRYFTR